MDKRKCWNCEEEGHVSRHCPKAKKPRASVRHVDDEEPERAPFFGMVDDEGFQKPRKTCRPMPRPATLNDFIDVNKFDLIKEKAMHAEVPQSHDFADLQCEALLLLQRRGVAAVSSLTSRMQPSMRRPR